MFKIFNLLIVTNRYRNPMSLMEYCLIKNDHTKKELEKLRNYLIQFNVENLEKNIYANEK